MALVLIGAGNPVELVGTLIALWFLILFLFYAIQYLVRKKYYAQLWDLTKGLDKKHLLSEVIEAPRYYDSLPYYHLLKLASKSMLEEITYIKNDRKEYKEYIEQWVHEIKTPISAIKLIGENHKSDVTRNILSELENVDHYVEQALFYARSEYVEHDYLIKEFSLDSCIHTVLVKNKQTFIQNRIRIELEGLDLTVYSDQKWIGFIINQLLMNSVQYKQEGYPRIRIAATDELHGISLIIEDNGVGISVHDLPRVFDKGFTGSNGRKGQKSTGIGLYLCKKMCDKLGLALNIDSKEQEFTRARIFFPKGKLTKM